MPQLSKTTTERIAACAVHDLDYWSDSPIPRTVWATSDDQRFHLVRINSQDRTALHVCRDAAFTPGMVLAFCPGDPMARPFVDVTSVAELEGSMLLAAASLMRR